MSKQNTAAEHGTFVTRLLTDTAGTDTSASEAADCKLRDGVDLEQYIRISADSIGELRKVDVYRVISSVRSGNIDGVTRRDLATYIAAKRHDLVAEVTDVMQEDFPQDDWAADCVAGRKMVPTPDDVHRGWLANLKEGDRVEVPYSLAKEDIKLMTVFENDGVWIRLLPDGFSKGIDNTVLVDAVSGVLHYASVRIGPPGTTNGKMPESRDCAGAVVPGTAFVIGSGYVETTSLHDMVDRAASMLCDRYGVSVEKRYNSNGRSGGAYVITDGEETGIGSNSSVGISVGPTTEGALTVHDMASEPYLVDPDMATCGGSTLFGKYAYQHRASLEAALGWLDANVKLSVSAEVDQQHDSPSPSM